ncbi:MAG: 16S rRNA (cytidine(1402)-2'-O)-methyltransferase [Candidatus Cloacimonadota bacterium]|nr:16S rRNA (cytidine(1402)-2'-O)-methyltransferase [Candidatus Cloacimonadota bacterium]
MKNIKKGHLFIVPTPIGNLEDMTFQAVKILKKVSLIAAEDTRTSEVLLKHYNIHTPMISYHKFNERARIKTLLKKLNAGENVAVITDAGTPGISDPCKIIVDEALKEGIEVIPLPGPAAFLTALSGSGLSTDSFTFFGFLPRTTGKQIKFLHSIKHLRQTLIFYESPNRIIKTLTNFQTIFGNRRIVVAKELTKIYETFFRGRINEVLSKLNEKNLKGEFVILLHGAEEKILTDEKIRFMLIEKIKDGFSKKQAIKEISTNFDLKKNRVYDISLQI